MGLASGALAATGRGVQSGSGLDAGRSVLHFARLAAQREVFYLVGTLRGKIQQYEKKGLELPRQKVRESVEVKLFAEKGEL